MKKRNQNDALVKAKSIKTEEHLLSILNYADKENESEDLTTIREDDLLENINRHRRIEAKKKIQGGRKALLGKQFIISFPPEFAKNIDELNLTQKKEMLKRFIRKLKEYILKIEPNIDIRDFVNGISADLHNDTEKRHIHLIQTNTIKLKDGTVKRLDLGKLGYSKTLKSQLFEEMRNLKPEQVEELDLDELKELRKKASQKNQKYATKWEIKRQALDKKTIMENEKWLKRLDKKLNQFQKWTNKPDLHEKSVKEGILSFYEDLKAEIAKSKQLEVKKLYTDELEELKKSKVDKRS